MPKRRSKRNTYTTPENRLFSSLRNTKEKITKKELSNLEINTKAAFNSFLKKVCPKYNLCPPSFFEDLISHTKELPNNYIFTLKFWINRIFYLYETVDSFSRGFGEDHLKGDKNVAWGNTFEKISDVIKKSDIPQVTIERYKRNLFNLRNDLIGSFTSENNLFSEFLTTITLPNSGLPISAISDLIEKFAEKIKKFDGDMFTNIKQGMIDPHNVIDNSTLKQMDTSQILTNSSLYPDLVRLPAPDVKLLTGSTGEIFPNKLASFGTGIGLGVFISSLVGGIAAGYCFFKKRNQQQLPKSSNVEANHEFLFRREV